MNNNQKTIIITGASSGIGKSLAILYLNKNWRVVLAARNVEKIKEFATQFPADQYLIVQTDVSEEEDCKNLIQKAINNFTKIDVLINNAGISMRSLFADTELHVIKKVMDINFWGTVYCTKYALPFIKESQGSIVGVSSIAGFRGLPGRTGYSASKFAMNGFLEALRTEELHTGVHVLTACPGFTASNIRNVALTSDGSKQGESPRNEQKMMTADEVSEKIYHAVEKRKRSLVLTNQGKLTVLLNKFLPKQLDRMVYNHMAKEDDSPFK